MMPSMCLSLSSTSIPMAAAPHREAATAASSSSSSSFSTHVCRCSFMPVVCNGRMRCTPCRRRRQSHVVCMAPDEEKLTRRNPLDFPIEWERPKPGRRPDIFPQFSPMKTPIPPPLPYDPPEEDEEEEEEKKKEEEEEEENPEKEDKPDNPEKQ